MVTKPETGAITFKGNLDTFGENLDKLRKAIDDFKLRLRDSEPTTVSGTSK